MLLYVYCKRLILANISLVSEDGTPPIDCPGDTKSYNCSIMTNAEELSLTWSVIFPDGEILTVTHDNYSYFDLELDVEEEFGRNITATLQQYRDGYVLSILTLPLFTNYSMDEVIVNCSIQDIGFKTEVVETRISGTFNYLQCLHVHYFSNIIS